MFESHESREGRVERGGREEGIVRRIEHADLAVPEEGEGEGDSLAALQQRAARLQHAMNNPLSALLAEEQLLGMDPSLSLEHRSAIDRMEELTRRLIKLVRDMDDLRGTHPPR